MNTTGILFSLAFLLFPAMAMPQAAAPPSTRTEAQTDVYFGRTVADPYRWLEDDRSAETAAWVKEQNAYTESALSAIPFRDALRKRIQRLTEYPRTSTPFQHGQYLFWFENSGALNQSVLYVRGPQDKQPRVLLDPNTLSTDGTVALGTTGFSRDARYMGYALSTAGSDWEEIRIREVATGKDLSERIPWVKFSGIAFKGNGFYYSRYAAPEAGKALSGKIEYHKVYYHTLGQDPANDVLVYEDKAHPLRNFSAQVTDDERYLILYGSESTSGNNLLVKDLSNPKSNWVTLADGFDYDFSVVHNQGSVFWIFTNEQAPNFRVVTQDISTPGPEGRKVFINELQCLMQSVSIAKNTVVVNALEDVHSKLLRYDFAGKLLGDLSLPGIGMVDAVNTETESDSLFFSFSGWTTPPTVYRYLCSSNQRSLYKQTVVPFSVEDYETRQVFYNSKDGTRIPMFIVGKKGMKLDGQNPCLLYGYGGFNISVTPNFSALRMAFLEQGGIFAVANIRGGGEYGERWHKAGTLLNKQHVFDDFIAAAEYLKKEGYTSTGKLAIHGRSNGGLLIGAVMTQRPDLCQVALPGVGVLDMLRYHKFTIGWAWATDYGTSDSLVHFNNLMQYSPLHNIKKVSYPATMIITSDHDDRVVPAHSFKFGATLQAHQQGNNPVLVRIDVNAGHGAGKPLAKQIGEWADIWAFTMQQLGMKPVFRD